MNTIDLLFEVGCEDLPARFVNPSVESLKLSIQKGLENQRISYESLQTFATPRRLVIVAKIADAQSDLSEERTGPPAKFAMKDGDPQKAAIGFAKGQGVDPKDIYIVETPKGEYVAVKVEEKGSPSAEILPSILEDALNALKFPKSMRWGTQKKSFGRPLRWLCAVLAGQPLPMEFAGVSSDNKTYGHRFSAPAEITITSSDVYKEALLKADVVIDFQERKSTISELVSAIAKGASGQIVDDPGLLNEVANLVEKPHAVLVEYSEHYLELPDEVLISSMRKHQRYFAIQNSEGKLINACAVVYNTPVKDPAVVAAGNLRVLKARLDDARFFWDQDLKHSNFDAFNEKLKSLVWIRGLGSMYERTQRISSLAATLAERLKLDCVEDAKEGGAFCKADLATQMVGEFTDLQGVIGGAYAIKFGMSEGVAQAIAEQYLPKGSNDSTPASLAGACVAIAEKMDAVFGCFAMGIEPKATADPYGLRRSTLGVIRILQDKGFQISIRELIAMTRDNAEEITPTNDAYADNIFDFFRARLKAQLAASYDGDIVEAVLAVGMDDILSVSDRVDALSTFKSDPNFEPLAAGFKRVVNILRKQAKEMAEDKPSVDISKLVEEKEKELYEASTKVELSLTKAVEQRSWTDACNALSDLRSPVDAFFDHVMVMVDDADLKKNRLAILFKLEDLFLKVADLSIID